MAFVAALAAERRRQEAVKKEIEMVKAWIIVAKNKGETRLTIYGELHSDTVHNIQQEYKVQHWKEYDRETGKFIRKVYRIFW